MPVSAADMDIMVVNDAVESFVESPAAGIGDSPGSSPAPMTKGHGLRRWRHIPREHHREGFVTAGSDEDSAQFHKHRVPLTADAPKGRHEVAVKEESSTAFVESRFILQEPAPAKLDPNLGLLIASTGFSVGTDSDNSEDQSSKSSSTASALRHDFSFQGDNDPRSAHGDRQHWILWRSSARVLMAGGTGGENAERGGVFVEFHGLIFDINKN